jgi:hypothetical protein
VAMARQIYGSLTANARHGIILTRHGPRLPNVHVPIHKNAKVLEIRATCTTQQQAVAHIVQAFQPMLAEEGLTPHMRQALYDVDCVQVIYIPAEQAHIIIAGLDGRVEFI